MKASDRKTEGEKDGEKEKREEKTEEDCMSKRERAGGSRQTSSTALYGKDASWKARGEPRHVIP